MQILEKACKTWKNRNTKLVTAKAKSYYLFLEPNYHKTIFFENLLVMEMKNTQVHMIEEEDSNVWVLLRLRETNILRYKNRWYF